MSTTVAYDSETWNFQFLPPGQHVGYTTGSPAWTTQQWIADALAVRVDQSPYNTALDETADWLDFELGAATVADIVPWLKAARLNYAKAVRPGQRWPGVYLNRSSAQVVGNALLAGMMTNVPLWLADPGISIAEAQAIIAAASGPWPIQGVQNQWFTEYDEDVFLTSWLATMSGKSGDTIWASTGGPAVQAAQGRLNAWQAKVSKYPKLTVDGAFGLLTQAAVKDFQAYKGLSVDGIVGPHTWAALDEPTGTPPPVLPNAPLAVASLVATSIRVTRVIPKYSGKYHTVVKDATGTVVADNTSAEGIIEVTVQDDNEYTVETGANGYQSVTKQVQVS